MSEFVFPPQDYREIDFDRYSRDEIGTWIAVLPLGATEQHGPHLPPETDTLIAEGLIARLKSQCEGELAATFLPVEPVGYSPEHMDYEGSKTLAYNEAIERWIGLGETLAKQGFRKLLLLNAHGGNSPLMTIVATELRVRFDMLCVATSWTRFGFRQALVSEEERAIDIHAGKIETSVMLALYPEKVDMAKAADFDSTQKIFLEENKFLSAYGKHAFGWKMQDLNSDGAVGNALAAKASLGEALLSDAVTGLGVLLQEIEQFDMIVFSNSPG